MQIDFPKTPSPDWPAQFIGAKWHWCGRGPDSYDCLGLLIAAFRQFGFEVKDWVPAETNSELERALQTEKLVKTSLDGWEEIAYPIAGCAILFKQGKDPHHVGVYTGKGDFIHACESVGQVVREPLPDHVAAVVGYFVPKAVCSS